MATHKILLKTSRMEVVKNFLHGPVERDIKKLLSKGDITQQEAQLLTQVPFVDDICLEMGFDGFSQGCSSLNLFSTFKQKVVKADNKNFSSKRIRLGIGGGIGTPETAAAAFLVGADFILTGTINQCSVEAGTSHEVKDILENVSIHDLCYVPKDLLFETGAKISVVKKGSLFPVRANHLYDLYKKNSSLDDLDRETREKLETSYFQQSIDQILNEIKNNSLIEKPGRTEKFAYLPKYEMSLVFKSYFQDAQKKAIAGNREYKSDYQIYCSPIMGAFNAWVKGTQLEKWKKRNVRLIAEKIMDDAAVFIYDKMKMLSSYFYC
ncbi:MAG: hypothetical protein MJB14_06790 [Spirochaetes bacterium]|nr:hypothetical protein [Spirochaetota bacterium]